GDAHVEIDTKTFKVQLNGSPFPFPAPPAQQFVFDHAGMVLKSPDLPGSGSLPKGLEVLYNVPAPAAIVKPGDTWTADVNNPGVPGKKVTISLTYLGSRRLRGIDTARVQAKADIPVSDPPDSKTTMSATGSYDLDLSNGLPVAADYTVRNVALDTGGYTVGVLTVHFQRTPPGVPQGAGSAVKP
ncbi:MAG TPA: hypothetical protein VGS41_00680, partial [Chthonomonadales bacterium]|nr:hypothetical protein [Chthonomonadales bacterium]